MTEPTNDTPEKLQSDLGIADVWHAGSDSFYRAQLLEKLSPEQALTLPPELQGDDIPQYKANEGIRGIIREAFIAGYKQRAPFDSRTAEGFRVLEDADKAATLYYLRVKSVMSMSEEAQALAEQMRQLRLVIDLDASAIATLTALLASHRSATHLQSSDPMIARQIEELRTRWVGNKMKLKRMEEVGR